MSSATLLALALCFALGLQGSLDSVDAAPTAAPASSSAAAPSTSGGNEEYAVNTVYNNQLIRFPYFDEQSRVIDPDLKELLIVQMRELFDYLRGFIARHVNSTSSWGNVRKFCELCVNMYSLGKRQKKARLQLDRRYNSERSYKARQKEMFRELSRMGQQIESDLKRREEEAKRNRQPSLKDPQKLVADVETLMDQMLAAFQESSAGVYVDWENGQIGERTFPQVASDLIGRLRFHGFGGVMDAVSNLVDYIMTVRRTV